MNPENPGQWRILLTSFQQLKQLQTNLLEILEQLKDTEEENESILVRNYTFGLTAFSLAPFMLSSLFVFAGKLRRAIFTTGIGFSVLLAILIIFSILYSGEREDICEETLSIGKEIEDISRETNRTWNQIDNLLSNLTS
jgi:hypothetical protein